MPGRQTHAVWLPLAGLLIGLAVLAGGRTLLAKMIEPDGSQEKRLVSGLAVFGLISIVLGLWVSPPFPQPSAPFQSVSCTAFGATAADLCGYVLVPEDRAKPDGKLVQLAVAVFKSASSSPAMDPVIFLQGGPGGALVGEWGPYLTSTWVDTFVGNRDLILVDQRGTGFSEPSLACPEEAKEGLQTLDENLTLEQADALDLQALRQCHDRLVGSGIDLSMYTTLTSAEDIAAIGPALGYQKVNLYGVSYGTRLALSVIRLHPAGIRSVVLDSVFPPQVIHYTMVLADKAHIFAAVFAACAANYVCHETHPTLAADFSALVTKLNAAPAEVKVTVGKSGPSYSAGLTGDLFVDLAFNMLYSSQRNGQVPEMIAQAKSSTFDLATQELSALLLETTTQYFSAGLSLSVRCSEDAPRTSPTQITAAAQGLSEAIRPGVLDEMLAALHTCQMWKVQPVPSWQQSPVQSTIPTLVVTGKYDPITPPTLGQLAAKSLSHSYFFTFPGRGHGQDFDYHDLCPDYITVAFLANPAKTPDASCMALMPQILLQ